jgi:signal peptide peptidase SppA
VLYNLADRFVSRPLALEPSFVPSLLEALANREGEYEARLRAEAQSGDPDKQGFALIGDIAVVPISGVLVHSHTGMWGEASYDDITASIGAALADPRVKGVALDIKSPGGEVDGAFEAADLVHGMRGGDKPIHAILNPYGYSAAYALASACDFISVPATGGAGSVGVISLHADISKALESFGVNVSVFTFGAQKAERGPFGPLSDGAKGRIQAEIDTIGKLFVSTVARNRSMTQKAVRDTEAGVFLGANAVEAGFADAVLSPQAAFSKLEKAAR